MKSSLAEEDEVDFVILSSFKHDLKSPTLKWADELCQDKGTPECSLSPRVQKA